MNLARADLGILSKGHCPACGLRGFVIGPQGGKSINIECAHTSCRARFNVAFFGGVAMMAQRLTDDHRPVWPSEPEPRA
jgi:hypothetical protein